MLMLYWMLSCLAVAMAFEPRVASSKFDHGLQQIVYFDDSSTIVNLNGHRLYKSTDNGASWRDVTSELGDGVVVVSLHVDRYHKERVFVFTLASQHYVTNDKAASWRRFDLDASAKGGLYLVNENVNSRKNVIISVLNCANLLKCENTYYYTDDEFETNAKKLVDNVEFCLFTATRTNRADDSHVLCARAVRSQHGRVKNTVLVSSSDWFRSSSTISTFSDTFVYDIELVESFVVVKAFADRYTSLYVDLYVSVDGKLFQKAHFPGDLKSKSFEILPSSDHSLYVLVWGFKKQLRGDASSIVSDLYVSDSDGITFRRLGPVGSDFYGFHSMEKINLEGALLGNAMTNHLFSHKISSMISFDDGRSWDYLNYTTGANSKSPNCNSEPCRLNLLSITEMTGDGHFQSGPTPGILLGVGAIDSSLIWDSKKLATWISRDGGHSWSMTLEMPCVFSMGDQGNVIVAVPYYFNSKDRSLDRSEFFYSFDQGNSWKTGKLDRNIIPTLLTTTVDGSSTSFLYSGFDAEDVSHFYTYALDFSEAFPTCRASDFEQFSVPRCVMGHQQSFRRRKQNAQCFVNKLYEDVVPQTEPCKCTRQDYECLKGFFYENATCVADLQYFRRWCSDHRSHRAKTPRITKIPGNTCQTDLELADDDYWSLDCTEVLKTASVDIRTSRNPLAGSVVQYVYLRQSAADYGDETVVVLTSTERVYISHNGGMDFFWASVNGANVVAIAEDRHNGDHVALLTPDAVMYVSIDRAQLFEEVQLPAPVNTLGYVPVVFHPHDTDTFIVIGRGQCTRRECRSVAFLTNDGGKTWTKMLEDARTCDFAGARFGSASGSGSDRVSDPVVDASAGTGPVTKSTTDPQYIICEQTNADGSVKVLGSSNMFKDTDVHFEHAVGIAPDDTFIVAAEIVDNNSALKSLTTVDGKTWAHAKFPADLQVLKEQAYTVMRSSTRSVLLHVTTSNEIGGEYGSLLKSNSNGTLYVLVEKHVNRNTPGYVDFEKIEGIEGLAVVNVVTNVKEVSNNNKKEKKKLKTKITHNDGAEWAYLVPPVVDSAGQKYQCHGRGLEECSLNLHGFTERRDYRDTYSSGSAVGMMVAVGNVGPHLLPKASCATFLSRDGGVTWREVYSRPMQWEYGDQGSIIILVDEDAAATDVVVYSLDEGETWTEYKFAENKVKVRDVATIPSDTSRRFVLFVASDGSDDTVAVGIDFSQMFVRQCMLDAASSGDFEYWTPKHPFLPDNCLFGHETRYVRRKPDRVDCFVGNAPLNDAHKVIRNCSCTRKDFECDYNFARAADGTCKLVDGLRPKDPKDVCAAAFEYFEPTGYRRIPLTTCVGGKQLDRWESKPCPGKDAEYDREHHSGLHGANLAVVVFVPVAVFLAAVWFVYDKGIRRNGGWARFGQIRLQEDAPERVENNWVDKIVNSIVDFGVVVFVGGAGVVSWLKKARRERGPHYTFVNQNQAFLDDEDDILGDLDEEDEVDDEDNFIISSDQFDDDAQSLSTVSGD